MYSSSLQINRVNLGVIIMTLQSGGKSREDVRPVSAASGLLPAKRTRVTWMRHSRCTWVSDLEGPSYLDVKSILQLRIVLTRGCTTKRLTAKRIMHRTCPWTRLNSCWVDAWFHWLSSPSCRLRRCLLMTAPTLWTCLLCVFNDADFWWLLILQVCTVTQASSIT